MLILSLLLAVGARIAPVCKPATGDANAVLERAATTIGLSSVGTKVLRVSGMDIESLDYESDRMYPPYLLQTSKFTEWFDPASAADRITTTTAMAGGSEYGNVTTLGARNASYRVRDTTLTPDPQLNTQLAATRPLNVWAVIVDWIAAGDARVAETCALRDYPRLVLTRPGANGGERLYVDTKSGYPVALEMREPHYLWGQVKVEYVYATWTRVGAAHLPGTATRMVDDAPEITRSFGRIDLVSRDSAPQLSLPAISAPMPKPIPGFLEPSAPDTIRVSANTYLLRNPGYAETVTLASDTVFVFDATQGDARARQDSAWIGKLFPGKHPIVVVVTDIAWPHVSGVRWWVAQGATIVSHRAARPFLERVVQRRWTDAPDALESRRAKGVPGARSVALNFRAVDDSLRLANGAITLFAIDGASSEVALAAYVHADKFLWGSDFIQSLAGPTQYLDEVSSAVARMGYTPSKVAAEHLPLSDWSRAQQLTNRTAP